MSFISAAADFLNPHNIVVKQFSKKFSAETLSDKWLNGNGSRIETFNGTKAALDQRITDMVNDCSVQVHNDNWEINTKTAKSVCRNRLEAKYGPLIATYTGAQAKEEATLKAVALEKNNKLIATVAVILAALITIVIILRIKNK